MLSRVLLVLIIVLIAILDVFLILKGNESFSNVILKTSKEWPVLPFVFGLVMGHLFWPNKE